MLRVVFTKPVRCDGRAAVLYALGRRQRPGREQAQEQAPDRGAAPILSFIFICNTFLQQNVSNKKGTLRPLWQSTGAERPSF